MKSRKKRLKLFKQLLKTYSRHIARFRFSDQSIIEKETRVYHCKKYQKTYSNNPINDNRRLLSNPKPQIRNKNNLRSSKINR